MSNEVKVSVRASVVQGYPDASASISFPTLPVAGRVAELGLEGMAGELKECAEKCGEVTRWNTLRKQIEAAKSKVAACEATERQVQAARVLLEANPESDLANKLREIEAKLAAAVASKEQAQWDLTAITYLAPRLGGSGEQRQASVRNLAFQRARSLSDSEKQAQQNLEEAVRKVEVILQTAVNELLAPALAEALAQSRAAGAALHGHGTVAARVAADAVGPMPAGVRPSRTVPGDFELDAPPAAPLLAPIPAPEPVPKTQYTVVKARGSHDHRPENLPNPRVVQMMPGASGIDPANLE